MAVRLLIKSRVRNIGEFSVNRLLPHTKCQMIGPWIFFDHMGPVSFPAGKGIDVRPHPHINLVTVTFLFEGEIFHRDSLGNALAIQPGDINLMVAGKGITHSERETEDTRNQTHQLNGLQLWHVLPVAYEEIDPAFYHYKSNQLPSFKQGEVKVNLLIGQAYGFESPVMTYTETLYLMATLKKNQILRLPIVEELGVYIVSGQLQIVGKRYSEQSLLVLEDYADALVSAVADTKMVLIGGKKQSARYIDWNFVSSRKSRILQARQDWKNGRFPKVPGDEIEYIPLPN